MKENIWGNNPALGCLIPQDINPETMKIKYGNCDECCRILPAHVDGITKGPGNPCFNLNCKERSCNVYANRPNGCRQFQCGDESDIFVNLLLLISAQEGHRGNQELIKQRIEYYRQKFEDIENLVRLEG